MKKILIGALLLAFAARPVEAVLIADFSSLPGGTDFSGGQSTWNNGSDQFTASGGIFTIEPVAAGNPLNNGYFAFADLASGGTFNATGLTQLSVTARLDSGNLAAGFVVNLFDGDGSGLGALTATLASSSFVTSGFTTVTVTVSSHPESGNIANIKYFGLAGTGTADAFRISFDNIALTAAAVPEPSAYAAIFGGMAVAFTLYFRRRRQIG